MDGIMPKEGLLSCLQKRELLNRSAVSVDELLTWARRYEEADLVHDAVDFYEKAQAWEDLERLCRRAVEEGDYFLLKRLMSLTGKDPSADQWRRLAERAEELGKTTFAEKAREMAEGNGEERH